MGQADAHGPYKFKVITSSAAVTTAGVGGYLKAFGLTVTTTAGSAQLMDNATGGTAGPELKLDAATAFNSISSGDIGPVRFNTDIFCNLVGANAEAWVIYNEDTT